MQNAQSSGVGSERAICQRVSVHANSEGSNGRHESVGGWAVPWSHADSEVGW